jgi:hypothetical protein
MDSGAISIVGSCVALSPVGSCVAGGVSVPEPASDFRSSAGVTQRATRVAIALHHGRQPSSPAFLLPRDRRCDSSVNMHIGNQKP